jgi:hypothetical protein
LCGQQIANRVAQGGLAAMAHVQRASGVGRDEFDQHLVGLGGLLAKTFGRLQHFVNDGLLGRVFEADVDEARTGDFDGIDPALESGCRQQGNAQGFRQLSRVLFQGLGQLHGGCASQIAMGGDFGGFEDGTRTCAGLEFFELSGQGREQMLFGRKHGGILRGPRQTWRAGHFCVRQFTVDYKPRWTGRPPWCLNALGAGFSDGPFLHISHLGDSYASRFIHSGFGFGIGFGLGSGGRPRAG